MSGPNSSKPNAKDEAEPKSKANATPKPRANAKEAAKPAEAPRDDVPARGGPDTGSALIRLLSGGFFGGPEAQFERLGRAFQRGMAPRDIVERMHIDLAIMAIFQLRQVAWALPDAAPGDMAITRAITTGHRLLMKSLDTLEDLAEEDAKSDPGGGRPEWMVPERDPEEGEDVVDPLVWEEIRPAEAEAEPDWRERIDLEGPPGGDGPLRGPVVRGTALSALNVVGMLEEGWSPRQILAYHPMLKMADLRACVACHQAGLSGSDSPEP